MPAPAVDALPWLAAGVALHLGYQLFLVAGYRAGDLTQVYPIARGSAPLIVAAVSVGALGVALGRVELLAVVLIGGGVASLALVRRADGARNPRAVAMALGTGCFIAAYSLVDGTGARVAGTASGYWTSAALGNAVTFTVWTAVARPGLLGALARATGRRSSRGSPAARPRTSPTRSWCGPSCTRRSRSSRRFGRCRSCSRS